jgi:hypothetical protein
MAKRKETKGQYTFEDTKGVIRSYKSKDRQYIGQKKRTREHEKYLDNTVGTRSCKSQDRNQ